MVGFILIFFVGKAFYDLAGLNNKSQWGFAILGVASYYAGTFIGGIMLAVLSELAIFSIENMSDVVLGILALPIGVLTCWGTYTLLKTHWNKAPEKVNRDEVLDGDMMK